MASETHRHSRNKDSHGRERLHDLTPEEREIQQKWIKEIVDDWERTGDIGNSKPETKDKAIEQAVAISYEKIRERRRRHGHPDED